MRLDKYLKVSRIIKRRTIAKEISENNRVFVNEKQAKPSYEVNVNDIITLDLSSRIITVKVLDIKPYSKAEDCEKMYEIIKIDKKSQS